MPRSAILSQFLPILWLLQPALAQSGITLTIRDNQGKLVTIPPANPAEPVDYVQWINKTFSAGITDNAAPLYAQAEKLFDLRSISDEHETRMYTGPWTDLPDATAYLNANRKFLDQFRLAAARKQCYFPLKAPESDPETAKFYAPALRSPRGRGWWGMAESDQSTTHLRASRLLLAQGWAAWSQGNLNQIVDNAVIVLQAARHLDQQPSIMGPFMAQRTAEMSYASMRKALSLSDQPAALAAQLEMRFKQSIPPPPDAKDVRAVLLEAALFRDLAQRTFVPTGKPGTYQASKDMLKALTELQAVLDPSQSKDVEKDTNELNRIGYLATIREGDELARLLQQSLAKPYLQAVDDQEPYSAAFSKTKNPLLLLSLPDMVEYRSRIEKRGAEHRATQLVVQLHLHRSRQQDFPERLDHLQTPRLKELRIDPFSGKDFVYRKQGDSFLLYSVGHDREDNNGRQDEGFKTGDYVYWPVQEPY